VPGKTYFGLVAALALLACGGGEAADQAPATEAAQTPAASAADSAAEAAAEADQAAQDSAVQADQMRLQRETFSYGGGARDPFESLLNLASSGPELSDLALVGIYLDSERPGNSVAVLRDRTSGRPYKLRAGDRVGRARVAQVRQQDVVFTIEDFGFERQETLTLPKREEGTP